MLIPAPTSNCSLRTTKVVGLPSYARIGLLVGGAGFVAAMVLMFVFMGLPVGAILLTIPVGVVTGKWLVRDEKRGESLSEAAGARAGLISGALTALGVVIPLAAIAVMAPEGATIGREFSKVIDPNAIPQPLNSIPVAMGAGALFSTLVVIGLATKCCTWTVKRYRKDGTAAETELQRVDRAREAKQ